MPKQGVNGGRIVLARSKESQVLYALGVGLLVLLLLFFILTFISGVTSKDVVDVMVGLCGIVILGPFLFIAFTEYFRKVVLLENHISIQTWHAVPLVYAYDQIVDIETVRVSEDAFRWRGSHVRLTFDDGATVKISNSLASARTFRKHLRDKSGRTFRKKQNKT